MLIRDNEDIIWGAYDKESLKLIGKDEDLIKLKRDCPDAVYGLIIEKK